MEKVFIMLLAEFYVSASDLYDTRVRRGGFKERNTTIQQKITGREGRQELEIEDLHVYTISILQT